MTCSSNTAEPCIHTPNCHHFRKALVTDVAQLAGPSMMRRGEIARQSLENSLVNLDILENRIFAGIQQMRSEIRQIIATLG